MLFQWKYCWKRLLYKKVHTPHSPKKVTDDLYEVHYLSLNFWKKFKNPIFIKRFSKFFPQSICHLVYFNRNFLCSDSRRLPAEIHVQGVSMKSCSSHWVPFWSQKGRSFKNKIFSIAADASRSASQFYLDSSTTRKCQATTKHLYDTYRSWIKVYT